MRLINRAIGFSILTSNLGEENKLKYIEQIIFRSLVELIVWLYNFFHIFFELSESELLSFCCREAKEEKQQRSI